MFVKSTVIPSKIKKEKNYIRITNNVTPFEDEEGNKMYKYNEILLKDISIFEVEKNFEDIFNNPDKYSSVIQINGKYTSNRR